MLVVVDSRSGYGLKFAEKLGQPVIKKIDEVIGEPCILITRNIGMGKIPPTTSEFLDKYSHFVKGVVVNGMKRFGPFYNKSADKLKKHYNLEIIAKIELDGSEEDVETVKQYLLNI